MTFFIHIFAGLIFAFKEGFKQVLPILIRDADTLIFNRNGNSNTVTLFREYVLLDRYFNHIISFTEFNRILYQVDHDLLNAEFIHEYHCI